ncbi:hypothetical protein Clacol_010198 [Clathrus columnatus]|uniref:C2H2-type domain-containing protein n=1 Tax=Clathrus columnatus TaxID=1419009 RepID=A0AAV5ARZ4_9AGAM|nr:hypothetical protein Clacol_010198 [Clathrus columnatus]
MPSTSNPQWPGQTEVPSRQQRNPHKCSLCGAGFSTPSALTTHFRSHTGEKLCSKPFSVASNLRRHERIHVASSAFEEANGSSSSTTR